MPLRAAGRQDAARDHFLPGLRQRGLGGPLMATLVLQYESDPNSLNQTFGLEVFHDVAEDYYTARFHVRTYEGIRVSDSWATGEVRLDAHTIEGAGPEVSVKFKEWLTAIGAQT